MVRELLHRHRENDGDPHDGLMVEYVDPTNGQPVFKTITFFMQMLHRGQKSLPVKSTANLLVSPFEGQGHSIVDGKKFDWNKFDTLAVPSGSWFEHQHRQGSAYSIRGLGRTDAEEGWAV